MTAVKLAALLSAATLTVALALARAADVVFLAAVSNSLAAAAAAPPDTRPVAALALAGDVPDPDPAAAPAAGRRGLGATPGDVADVLEGVGLTRLVTETVIGAAILATIIVFLKHIADERASRAKAEELREARTRELADEFREDVRTLVARSETHQERLVERFEQFQHELTARFEKNQGALGDLLRDTVQALASHDAMLRMIEVRQRQHDERQDRLELFVYRAGHAELAPEPHGPALPAEASTDAPADDAPADDAAADDPTS